MKILNRFSTQDAIEEAGMKLSLTGDTDELFLFRSAYKKWLEAMATKRDQ